MAEEIVPLHRREYQLLLDAAGAAPSVHNSQPWSFPLRGDRVEVWVDDRRALPRVDPDGRQRVISCGAATLNLRLAMEHLGYEPVTTVCPPGSDERHVATVARGGATVPDADAGALYESVAHRRTNRGLTRPEPVARAATYRLRRVALDEGAVLQQIHTAAQRVVLYDVLRKAIGQQLADPELLEEFATWTGQPDDTGPAGGAGGASGVAGVPVTLWEHAPFPNLASRGGRPLSTSDEKALATMVDRGTFFLLTTAGDDRAAWLRAGMAVQRVLLTAHRVGLAVCFLNQPVESPAVRATLPGLLHLPGAAQLLLRVGYEWTAAPGTRGR